MRHHPLVVCTTVLSVLLPASAMAFVQTPQAAAAEIRVEPDAIELRVGETTQLATTVHDAAGNLIDADVVYISRSRRGLGVSSDGLLTAHAPGSHQLIIMVPSSDGARGAGLRRQLTVTVPSPPLASLRLLELPELLYASSRVRMQVRIQDTSGASRDDDEVAYSSSDTSVATVDRFGYLNLLQPGAATINAMSGGTGDEVNIEVLGNVVQSVQISVDSDRARTGDVVHFAAVVLDAAGERLDAVPIQWAFRARTEQAHQGEPPSGLIDEDGRFVADLAGEYTIVAIAGGTTASASIRITPRNVQRNVELVGQGAVRDRFTSDLWVWEGTDGRDYVLTGTWSADGHAYMWDVTDPSNIQLVDTIHVDARTVNDLKVSADGRIAVISREGASNRRNGLVILDVSDPAAGMKVLSRYDDELTGGVHNVFIDNDHVYALSAGRRYDIINIEDPTNPHRVGRFELDTPGHSIHDVWVHDGIAYSSNWADGVVAVDVGGGGRGGSPRNPVMMASSPDRSGRNHAAFPYRSQSTGKRYTFAGDEAALRGKDPGLTPGLDLMAGFIHVLEWDDWDQPREVARYQVPEAGSHNLWVEDDILYVAFYQGGLRVVDVSGELMGDLYRQGREIANFRAWDPRGHIPNVAMTWGPQPHKGTIFFTDMHSGLWAVRLEAAEGPSR